MCNAAKVMGNTQLEVKFSRGIELIKRDIVFAASLYIQFFFNLGSWCLEQLNIVTTNK